jgi:hypothetical protein
MKMVKTAALVLMVGISALIGLMGCSESTSLDSDTGDDSENSTSYAAMEGDTADCELDVVTIGIAGGDPVEVHLNGLKVEEMSGANKVGDAEWEVVTRRGVSFDEILTKAGIEEEDDAPVNCVARDGFDPLRTKLSGDTSKLPTLSFMRDFGYVYVGSPGDKDPLYPEMEGKSLIVDYDVSADDEVPEYLGGAIASIGMFRWKMIEKIDAETRGVIEIDPVVE